MCHSSISAYANLPNSSCHFWKHKSFLLQILLQSSMPTNVAPLYFFLAHTLYTLIKGTIVWIGVSTPTQNTTPFFLAKPLFKSVNSPSLHFIVFLWMLPHPTLLKSRIFQWTSKIFKFFILDIILSFKSN